MRGNKNKAKSVIISEQYCKVFQLMNSRKAHYISLNTADLSLFFKMQKFQQCVAYSWVIEKTRHKINIQKTTMFKYRIVDYRIVILYSIAVIWGGAHL